MEPDGTADVRVAVASRGPGSTAGDLTTRKPELSIAAGLAGGVLGAGMLVMPPVVAALAGGDSLPVWAAHILLGGSVSLLLSVLVRARLRPASLAGAVGALLGPWAERAVDGVFAVAFTAGQAAIAWFAATCLLTAADGTVPRPGTAGLLLALGMLAVAVVAALGPLSLSPSVLRLRPWAAGALALLDAVWVWPAGPAVGPPTPLAVTGLSPGGARWLAFAALFFAGVGWEAVTHVVPTAAAGARRTAAGVALGTAAVAVVYLGLAEVEWLAARAPTAQGSASVPLRWVLAGATAAVLTSYCLTNVRTAARIATRLRRTGPDRAGQDRAGQDRAGQDRRGPGKAVIGSVGAACCAFACAGARDGAVPLLLLGPAAAALTGYALAAVAAVRRGGPLLRGAAAAVLLVLVTTAALAVPALFGG
ncbi:amino acid:polyamine antiporter [Streptacidiphilus sp. EB103A]|uniref:amino acid:polyamine antiporter n=1 Tax=Streptacidiphilus sp. EB103A TaxID=3156275 RepID=UPI003517576D